MTVSLVGLTSPQRTTPYITSDMFKLHSRAGVQVESLAPKGAPVDQQTALDSFIEQASSWMDEQAEMTFAASLDTWSGFTNVSTNGFVEVYPRYRPVIGITAFSVGPSPSLMSPMSSFTGAVVHENSISVPTFPLAAMTSSEGPIQFGGISAPYDQAFTQYSYVHGYPVTLLTADVAAGANQITVADTTGIVAGQTWLTVRSGRTRYRFLATSVSTADAGGLGFGPGTVGCSVPAPALVVNPDVAIQVDSLPAVLITACVLVTRAFIKGKTPSTPARSGKERKTTAGDDYQEAWEIIRKFAQVSFP